MQLRFTSMQGTGNRILIVDEREQNREPPAAASIRAFANGPDGLDFDQLMWVREPFDFASAASYRVFNADGSEVEQCGNGARCVAWLLGHRDGLGPEMRLDSPAGTVEARLCDANRVAVNMGLPEFEPARIPFVADTASEVASDPASGRYRLELAGETFEVSVLSMGNPHCVIDVDDVEKADVARIGAAIESHERFPERVNVGFMAIINRRKIALRVHERGVGETLACGTGACAAVVAGRRRGLLDAEVAVNLPGGQLVVSWRGAGRPVWLSGDVEVSSEGTIDV